LPQVKSKELSHEEVAALARDQLESMFCAAQHDHIRRKEAFDALTNRFTQSELSLEEERKKRQSLENENKRLSTELVRYIELASNAGTQAKGHDRNLHALTETLQKERERANAAASALKVLDEDLVHSSKQLEAEKKRCAEFEARVAALQHELGASRSRIAEGEQRALEASKLRDELRRLKEQASNAHSGHASMKSECSRLSTELAEARAQSQQRAHHLALKEAIIEGASDRLRQVLETPGGELADMVGQVEQVCSKQRAEAERKEHALSRVAKLEQELKNVQEEREAVVARLEHERGERAREREREAARDGERAEERERVEKEREREREFAEEMAREREKLAAAHRAAEEAARHGREAEATARKALEAQHTQRVLPLEALVEQLKAASLNHQQTIATLEQELAAARRRCDEQEQWKREAGDREGELASLRTREKAAADALVYERARAEEAEAQKHKLQGEVSRMAADSQTLESLRLQKIKQVAWRVREREGQVPGGRGERRGGCGQYIAPHSRCCGGRSRKTTAASSR